MPTGPWPSSRDYVEAVQNPGVAFQDPDLRTSVPAIDRLGMPFVTSGQFAYVFKLNTSSSKAQAVRCFRGAVGDRQDRYQKIDDHLDKVSAPCFVSFEYDPQGILVGGQRYPIQVMEWIGGYPLDVYLPNVLGRKDMLKFLADQWLKALATLRDGGMAHGDLQHGNVIVDESNSLRLVDLDGMYVPSMVGWKSSELGHRHYQHPKRSAEYFDATLDNFSGLVIHLSLLALGEQPSLWQEFHDENLIFVKSDFEAPQASKLLGKIKLIGGDCKRLAEALEKACSEDPSRCPSVLDLIGTVPSKLPSWMINSPVVAVQQSTREVKPGQVPPPVVSNSFPFADQRKSAGKPWYLATSAGVTPQPQVTFTTVLQPVKMSVREVARQTVAHAFLGVFAIWLIIPLLRMPFVWLGASSLTATWLAIVAYLTTCSVLAYRRVARGIKPPLASPSANVSVVQAVSAPPPAVRPVPNATLGAVPVQSSRLIQKYSLLGSHQAGFSNPASRPQPKPQPGLTPRKVITRSPVAIPNPLVGSSIRLIYHRPSCKWALKISQRNRVRFSSEVDAKARGYRPCSVCSP
ncbi:Ada metal-binding domain-containing protein [Terriglobus roseus]|uniref:Metal binding domain of Ada n=1 Tax=Terriglobus roseus TaxID=392734 RepID=A0A1G7QQ84_9BACT|nr:Ada metal-binding domain-containing protein [Terriglobus roseus]SDG00662.1 Metal binding domain of Ada [Terriglobus roseus]